MIKIKRRNQPGWLVWLLVVFPFFFGTLNGLVGLPWAIRYLMDAAWVSLLGIIIRNRMYAGQWKMTGISIWVMLFFLTTALVYLPNFQSGLFYLWGMRNLFRLYAAFLAFSVFLKFEDARDYLKLFDTLFWLNAVVSIYQFFFLDLEGDYLGGLFGAEKGGNGYTNIFMLIVVTKSLILFLEKKESGGRCVVKCATALLIAALAEQKFFFLEFLFVILLSVLFTNFTWRKLGMVVGAMLGVAIGVGLLTELFPEFSGWFSIQWFFENAVADKGYTSTGDLNRLNAIPQINELWLKTWGQRLFGLGLGNCDTSGFAIVNTPFFERFGDLHYNWISYAMIYLETGYIGLVFYFGFFVLVYLAIRRIERKMDGMALSYCRISRIMCILCAIISVYNSSLRTEAGYMAYFVLAIPFACYRMCSVGKG